MLEFIEMVSRVAKEASFPPPPEIDEYGDEIESEMTVEERKAQPLHEKLKHIIPTLLDNVCDHKFEVKWTA